MFDKKQILNGTVAGIFAGILTTGGAVLWFWSNIKVAFLWIYDSVDDPVVIPEYNIMLIIIGTAGTYYLATIAKDYFTPTYESYRDYRKDIFWGIKWTWDYDQRKNVSNTSVKPICPECNQIMSLKGKRTAQGTDITEVICTNKDCELSLRGEGDDARIQIGVPKIIIKNELALKVDRELRNMGLKN